MLRIRSQNDGQPRCFAAGKRKLRRDRSFDEWRKRRVVDLSEQEFMQVKVAIMDEDGQEALRLLKEFVKRIEQQKKELFDPVSF